jgi:hypothetical protein
MAIVAKTEDSDYSPTWKWADEEELVGAHVEFRRASTENGDKVVWELDSDEHGRVSVWVDPANLEAKVRAELARRKAKLGEPRLVAGERVRLNPGTKRPSKRTPGQTVWPFPVVEFEHGLPDTSAEELLLSGTPAPDEGEVLEEAVADVEDDGGDDLASADDDIPF